MRTMVKLFPNKDSVCVPKIIKVGLNSAEQITIKTLARRVYSYVRTRFIFSYYVCIEQIQSHASNSFVRTKLITHMYCGFYLQTHIPACNYTHILTLFYPSNIDT